MKIDQETRELVENNVVRSYRQCIQGGPAKVMPTYIFDGNIWMHS